MTDKDFERLYEKLDRVGDHIKELEKERDFYKRKYHETMKLLEETLETMRLITLH